MRKQLLVITSVAVASFLVGTMFSVRAIDGDNPFARIWQVLYGQQEQIDELTAKVAELEERVSALEPPEPELVGYWSFDEGTGTTAGDSSGNDNNGIIYGAAWVDGKIGYALSFDGIDDYVEVPNDLTLQASTGITLAAWVKVDETTGDYQMIADKWYPEFSYSLEFLPNGEAVQFVVESSSRTVVVSSVTIPIGTWAHITGTYDGTTAKIYVNGTLAGSQTITGTINIGTQLFCIGSHSTVASWDRNWFNGIIDEVRIYNGALSAEEIESLYQA